LLNFFAIFSYACPIWFRSEERTRLRPDPGPSMNDKFSKEGGSNRLISTVDWISKPQSFTISINEVINFRGHVMDKQSSIVFFTL